VRFAALLLACAAAAAHAQQKPGDYPGKPVRLIAGVAPGGGLDTITRSAAQILTEHFRQTVVVDNRPGGGTVLAMDLIAHAAPDGYTLMSATETLMLVGALRRVAYDVRRAYAPIVQMTQQPYVLVITPALPIKSIRDLVEYAKSKPGALNYGSSGIGTASHLGMERLSAMVGVKMVHVPYKGATPAMLDIVAGQIQLTFASTISATPHARSGRLRAVAVTGLKRVPTFPELPTIAESGIPGFKLTNSYSLFAPAGTPRPIVLAINQAVSQGMHTPDMMKRLIADGSEAAESRSPDELKAMFARDYEEVEKLVKALNIKY